MRDMSHAPDHVFRDELDSFDQAPAWHEELDTVTTPDGRVVTGPTADDWQRFADEAAPPRFEVSDVRVTVGGAEVEGIESYTLTIRDSFTPAARRASESMRRVGEAWSAMLADVVATGRDIARVREALGCGDQLAHAVVALAREARVDVREAPLEDLVGLALAGAALSDDTLLCRHCGDWIGRRDRDGAWVDVNGLRSCAPHAEHHAPSLAARMGPDPSEAGELLGTIEGVRVVADPEMPAGHYALLTPRDEAALSLARAIGFAIELDGSIPTTFARALAEPTVTPDQWERQYDGEQLEPGCIADIEDSLDGGMYVPCGRPTGDDGDWCPEHRAAIAARAQEDT